MTVAGNFGIANAAPAYALDVTGDVNTTGVYRDHGVPIVTGGAQTPWTSDIDAASFALNNVSWLGVGATANKNANPIYIKTTNLQNYSVACVDTAATTLIPDSPPLSLLGASERLWRVRSLQFPGAPLAGNAELASRAALVFTTGVVPFPIHHVLS